ncbi:protein HEADING DATE 3B-like isoform X2 [Wolffia australiana]
MKRGREDEEGDPPKNKMELYEMFTIPSHMLKSDRPSSFCQPDKDHRLVNREKATAAPNVKNFEEREAAAEGTKPLENHLNKERKSEKAKSSKSGNTNLDFSYGRGELCSGGLIDEEDRRVSSSCEGLTVEGSVAELNDHVTPVEGEAGCEISPDDVVGLIGTKYFWKLRRTIAKQQRVFGMQIFELHRLIKVQELLSGSPQVLLGEIPPLNVQPEDLTKDPDYFLANPQPLISNQKASTYPVSSDCTPLPTRFKTMENSNQWLIPIMSPTEGLIYKPYHCTSPYSPVITEVDLLKQDSWSSCNGELPTTKPFSQLDLSAVHRSGKSTSSDVQIPRACVTPLPWISSLQGSAPPSQVIKVAPDNPMSTPESAARILQSIQRERQQYKCI